MLFKILGVIAGLLFSFSLYGAAAGFFIGSFIDDLIKKNALHTESPDKSFDYYNKTASHTDFASMIMVLSAAVMKADGRVLRSELDYIKTFFRQQFGNQFTTKHLNVLKHFLAVPSVPVQRICFDIKNRLRSEDRVLLIHYLFGIANADGNISASEIAIISKIAGYMGLHSTEFESVKNMFVHNTNSDFKILGLNESATNEEIKKAYRASALENHPDRVAHLGPEYQKRAKQKFQQIQAAYENIKKARGFV